MREGISNLHIACRNDETDDAYTHYSYAVMDALESVHTLVPAIEVHMSNIYGRDDFRHTSVTAKECVGQIAGMGKISYKMAMCAFKEMIDKDQL